MSKMWKEASYSVVLMGRFSENNHLAAATCAGLMEV